MKERAKKPSASPVNAPVQAKSAETQPVVGVADQSLASGPSAPGGDSFLAELSDLPMGAPEGPGEFFGQPVQLASDGAATDPSAVQRAAAAGVAGAGSPLPHLDTIQESFGHHDVAGVRAHTDGAAGDAASAMGARAYATGHDVAFAGTPDLHTTAHEAAHVVQQRAGVQLKANVGEVGDRYEVHADKVADLVVSGESAESLLDTMASPGSGTGSAVQQRAVQFKKGDYKTLWSKDPGLAKLTITQSSGLKKYEKAAKAFEQKLGPGLFVHPSAHEGANELIDKIAALIGGGAEAAFTLERANEAGAIPGDKIQEARDEGNLREKMFMVYTAIRSGAVAEAITVAKGEALPTKQDKHGQEVTDHRALNQRVLPRRGSTAGQERENLWGQMGASDRMTKKELAAKGAPLSEREQTLAGGTAPKFVPGEHGYGIKPTATVEDTSGPGDGVRKTFAQYQAERLAPLAAGLSGTTDWYFNVAKKLGMDKGGRQKLRLAALGQMLTNRDHSFHEIMHEAKTQGELSDYPDELPIGYTTLAPLGPEAILGVANTDAFPGDSEAAKFMSEDAKKVGPSHDADDHGLPTATGLLHLAGGASFFGGARYKAIRDALDGYSTGEPASRKGHLAVVRDQAAAWLAAHQDSTKSKHKKRVPVMQWLNAKAVALLADQDGPAKAAWIQAWEVYSKGAADTAEAAEIATAQAGFAGAGDDAARLGLMRTALTNVDALIATGEYDGLTDFRSTLAREVERTESVRDANFVASSDDLSLDVSNLRIDPATMPPDLTRLLTGPDGVVMTLQGDYEKQLLVNAAENARMIREARTRGGGPYDNADLDAVPEHPDHAGLAPMLKRVRERSAAQEATAAVDQMGQSHIEDFQDNVDTEVLNHVAPGQPVDEFLKRLAGQPLPAELSAIAAYAEDGFYKVMNRVLNKWDDEDYLRTVPPDVLKLCRLATSGLRKMKPYKGGSVYRGIPGPSRATVDTQVRRKRSNREQYWQRYDKGWTSKQFLSTSKRWGSSYAVKKNKFLAVEIQDPKSGVDISAISNTLHEREVLFPPGAPLSVVRIVDGFETRDNQGRVKPGTEDDKLDIPYDDKTEPGRVHVVLQES